MVQLLLRRKKAPRRRHSFKLSKSGKLIDIVKLNNDLSIGTP